MANIEGDGRTSIRCAVCGTDAEDMGLGFSHIWDDPRCPQCERPLTPEGLLVEETTVGGVRTLREIGKGGIVVWEHPVNGDEGRPTLDEAKRFLDRIQELGATSQTESSEVISIEQLQAKWNRKAASRRFRRWFHYEYANRPLELDNPALKELAAKILSDEPSCTPISEEIENEQKYFGERLAEYRARTSMESPLIVSRLSPAARLMIVEAQDAFRFGLFRAVFAICRAVLEDVIRDVVRGLPNAPTPIDETRLEVLINCVPDSILPPRKRAEAHEVRKDGNGAVHEASRRFNAKETAKNLRTTIQLIGRLLQSAEPPG